MSKKKVIVLFEKNKVPRIHINGNENELSKLGDILVNPKVPKGVSPHKWVKLGSKIGIASEEAIIEIEKKIKKELESPRIERIKPKLDKFKLCVILGGIALAVSNVYFNIDQIITIIERIQ